MKALVLGAGGMAGHVLSIYLRERGHTVVGAARRNLGFCETIIIDLLDREAVSRLLSGNEYDVVVNCAGVLNRHVDADPFAGIYVNSCLPHLLARISQSSPMRVVHISTDCVFSGNDAGGYYENDFRSADTLYGRSKALGELNDGKNLTFRTSIVGPELRPDGEGLFNWFMGRNGETPGYNNAIWTGVTTPVLARAVEKSIETGLTGLYHLTNNIPISKLDLLRLFNNHQRDAVPVTAAESVRVDKSLRNSRADFDFPVPSYAIMVAEMAEWIERHRGQYPHYADRIKT